MKDDNKEKGLSADEVYDRTTWRRIIYHHTCVSTPHKSGNKMKEKKNKYGPFLLKRLVTVKIMCKKSFSNVQ